MDIIVASCHKPIDSIKIKAQVTVLKEHILRIARSAISHDRIILELFLSHREILKNLFHKLKGRQTRIDIKLKFRIVRECRSGLFRSIACAEQAEHVEMEIGTQSIRLPLYDMIIFVRKHIAAFLTVTDYKIGVGYKVVSLSPHAFQS